MDVLLDPSGSLGLLGGRSLRAPTSKTDFQTTILVIGGNFGSPRERRPSNRVATGAARPQLRAFGANEFRRRLRALAAAGKAAMTASERPMIGIAAIFVFLLVIAVLNRYEFGRFD